MNPQPNLAQHAYTTLFPNHKPRTITLTYSAKFKPYNANITKRGDTIHCKLSTTWQEVSPEIQTGVIQHLLCKLFKTNKETNEMRLYNTFLKQLSRLTTPQPSDPELTTLFHELNQEYFNGFLDQPTLIWGTNSKRTLGHYHYASDTITISTILKPRKDLLKYVLYHELLHKKHSFHTKGTRTHHHTRAFRHDERRYHDPDIEHKLETYLANQERPRRRRNWLKQLFS